MGKTRNTNYEILDKILNDAGVPERKSAGRMVFDEEHPDGVWVTNQEELDQLHKTADDIEKYLRS